MTETELKLLKMAIRLGEKAISELDSDYANDYFAMAEKIAELTGTDVMDLLN